MKQKAVMFTKVLIEVMIICYYILNAFIAFKSYENTLYLFISICLLLLDIILYLLIIIKEDNMKIQKIIPYIKILLNIIALLCVMWYD